MWNFLTGPKTDFGRDFLLDKKADENRIHFIRNYFDKMVKYQNKVRLSFKLTGPARMSYLLSIFPDAVFVIVNRRIVPTISSFLKVDFWQDRGINKLWWIGAYTESEKKWAEENRNKASSLTAFQIKKVKQITMSECKKYKPKYIEVKYEDFVKNPHSEVLRILSFLNLELQNMPMLYLIQALQ